MKPLPQSANIHVIEDESMPSFTASVNLFLEQHTVLQATFTTNLHNEHVAHILYVKYPEARR